jgi:uncharacterized protein YndB with AHSA1/START domain
MTVHHSQPSVVDAATFTVRRTISIAAPVEKVWAAVTEPEHISRWFGKATFDRSGAGAVGTLFWEGYGAVPVRIEEIDPPRLVSYRWGNDDALGHLAPELDVATSTVFTFTLTETDGGTELTVVETGFDRTSDPVANLESHRGGWDSELDKLIALVESA